MGLRYRKSINFGGGFRVNLSKSGIGYSCGTKGYRITKKVRGGTRTTYSVPGTGLLWVDEGGKNKNRSGQVRVGQNAASILDAMNGNVVYQATDANVSQFVTDNFQEFVAAIKRYVSIRKLLKWGCILSLIFSVGIPVLGVVFFISFVGYIIFASTKKVSLEYDCDEYGNRRIQMLDQAMNLLMNNRMVWQVKTIQRNSSVKTNAGASRSVDRKVVRFQKKKPYFLKTDATCYHIKLISDDVFILPDRLIVKGKKGLGVVEYEELDIGVGSVNFIEDTAPPEDAAVIGYTWQYVNKNDSPDKRYKNNRQLPRCNYGSIAFKSATGLDVLLYISNRQNALSFKGAVGQMISEAKQMRFIIENEMKQSRQEQNQTTQEAIQPIIQNETVIGETEDLDKYIHDGFEDFILKDLDSLEREVLQRFWDGLVENNVNQRCACHRKVDGSIEVSYKGTSIGSFYLRGESGWLVYPMGNSGKTKQIDGSMEEIVSQVSKWIRYIMNYM